MDKEPNTLKDRPDLNESLLSWKGPSHPFKKRDRVFYQTVAALTFLLIVIVFFLNDSVFLLVGVILSIAFVVYAIAAVPPIDVEHKITPLGFDDAGHLFHWIELSAFWFEEKWGYKMLIIQTRLAFPAQIRAVIKDVDNKKVKDIMGKYLRFMERPPKNWVDNASDWLSQKIPLESTS